MPPKRPTRQTPSMPPRPSRSPRLKPSQSPRPRPRSSRPVPRRSPKSRCRKRCPPAPRPLSRRRPRPSSTRRARRGGSALPRCRDRDPRPGSSRIPADAGLDPGRAGQPSAPAQPQRPQPSRAEPAPARKPGPTFTAAKPAEPGGAVVFRRHPGPSARPAIRAARTSARVHGPAAPAQGTRRRSAAGDTYAVTRRVRSTVGPRRAGSTRARRSPTPTWPAVHAGHGRRPRRARPGQGRRIALARGGRHRRRRDRRRRGPRAEQTTAARRRQRGQQRRGAVPSVADTPTSFKSVDALNNPSTALPAGWSTQTVTAADANSAAAGFSIDRAARLEGNPQEPGHRLHRTRRPAARGRPYAAADRRHARRGQASRGGRLISRLQARQPAGRSGQEHRGRRVEVQLDARGRRPVHRRRHLVRKQTSAGVQDYAIYIRSPQQHVQRQDACRCSTRSCGPSRRSRRANRRRKFPNSHGSWALKAETSSP